MPRCLRYICRIEFAVLKSPAIAAWLTAVTKIDAPKVNPAAISSSAAIAALRMMLLCMVHGSRFLKGQRGIAFFVGFSMAAKNPQGSAGHILHAETEPLHHFFAGGRGAKPIDADRDAFASGPAIPTEC